MMWDGEAARQPPFWLAAIAVCAGAAILLWPALFNGYPILFSDTHAFLIQGAEPRMIWDKPFAYGPFLRLLHGGVTLWLPACGQALLVSHLLWLTRAAFAPPGLIRHLVTILLLAVLSTAPWTASLLMPDIFAPVTVLTLFLLGFGDRLDRSARLWCATLAVLAIAVHLSHLVIAAACVVVVAVLRTQRARLVALPLILALGFLIATNLVAYGRFAVSPFGSVFMLARLAADGPAARTLLRACPRADWSLCAWAGRMPRDSDAFLWDGAGPVWTTPGGPQGLAREAGAIVAATLLADPVGVAHAAATNTGEQLLRAGLGDTLRPTWLEGSVTNSLRDYFPPQELIRFRASRQARDTLAPVAAALDIPRTAAMAAGAVLVILMVGLGGMRGRAFAALLLVGIIANAFATGALSKPHDRYQARIAWLLVAAPLLVRWRPEED